MLTLATGLVFNSCNKDEHFDGQEWVGEQFKNGDEKIDITLSFTGNQVSAKFKIKNPYYGDESFTAKGTYTYDKKKVTMKVVNDDYGVDDKWSGKVDKKTMTLNVVLDNY